MNSSHTSALRRLAVTSLVTIACAGTAVTAHAAYIINATEVGGNVLFAGSGSIDLTALSYFSTATGVVVVQPNTYAGAGPTASRDLYLSSSLSGSLNMGPGTALILSSAGTGDHTQINFADDNITVPAGYTSKDALSGTATFTGHNFASLGLTPGTYDWIWGSGSNFDSFTVNVGAVPIPAAVWLFGSGLLGLIGVARRKARA